MRNLVFEIGPNAEIQDYRIETLSESDEQLCRQALERIQGQEAISLRWVKHLLMTASGLGYISKEAVVELFKVLKLKDV